MRTGTCYGPLVAIFACVLAAAVRPVDAQPGAASMVYTNERATLEGLRQTRDTLSAITELEAALGVASEIVAALEGRGDDMSDDLLELALIQVSLEHHDAAEISYLRVIDVREREQGIFSPDLIRPLHALGRTYIELRRFKDALYVLQRAQSISQRNRGLFNVEQMALIDDMTLAQLGSGNRSAAAALQEERLERAIRHFGPDTAELIPFYQHLGDYYAQSFSGVRARDQYRKALEISALNYGDSSGESVELLRRLTAVELRINRRAHARDRLAAALDAASAIDAKERGMSLAVLGDWATVKGEQASAERYYLAAYTALQEADDVDADDFFATPVMLDFVQPWDGVDGAARFPVWNWGRIELLFDVSATGRASDVRTLTLEPRVASLERNYKKHIRDAHFRPGLEKGRPVARSDVSYMDSFRYYLRD